ncbi:MAG: immunity 26/phosphotriesterase HocA family protein [Thermomicrobiales bacterium]
MGADGYEIFDDDVACDVRAIFEDALVARASITKATGIVLNEYADSLEDKDDGTVIYLALAALQCEYGKLQSAIRDRALAIIDNGEGLARWEDAGPESLAERKEVLSRLGARILDPAPPKPVRRKPQRPRKLPYQEGDWFAVPLRDGGFGVGIVARMDGKGRVLGYFFGPRRDAVPLLPEVASMKADQAVWIHCFGDLGLIEKDWTVLGNDATWNRADWPMPAFGHRDSIVENRQWKREYSGANMGLIVKQTPVSFAEYSVLPKDGIGGRGFVEIKLTIVLSE